MTSLQAASAHCANWRVAGKGCLACVPPHVAAEICKGPADFIRAAKRYCEPELF
jgi:hypothetical protein